MKTLKFIILFFSIFIINSAWAGWVIDHDTGNVIYLSSGKLKDISQEDDSWSIYDSKAGKFIMINTAKKIYWQGTAKKFCEALKQMVPQIEVRLTKPEVSIKSGGSETIAGFTTKKYQVKANGQLYKEVWITENRELKNDMQAFEKYEKEMSGCRPPQTMEEMLDRDSGYRKLMSKGYALKEVTYESGMLVNKDEVTGIKQKTIPAAEFNVPGGYRRVQTLMVILR